MLDPAELEDRPRLQDQEREELVAGGSWRLFLAMLPWLVRESSAVESLFASWLAGAIVRCGCVTIASASTQYRSETASVPAVSV